MQPDCRVSAICDGDATARARALSHYPAAHAIADAREIVASPEIDAVAIVTPVSTHYGLARRALENGKHVFIEKPFTATSDQAEHLIELAERKDLVIMVDHTFLFTGAVRKMKELIDQDVLGRLYYYDSTRVNLGLFQHDVNVIWDLAVHDLSIMDYVLDEKPIAVSATGMAHVPGQPENIAYLTLFYQSSLIAHVHVNWLAPVKVRRTLVGGSRKMIVYDDLEPSEKIKVYDKGLTLRDNPESVYQRLAGYRSGDMWAPQLELSEALHTEANHFVRCILSGEAPVTDGRAGLRVVRILEAASQSMRDRGQVIELGASRWAA
jgi:predicted dehydrogenase